MFLVKIGSLVDKLLEERDRFFGKFPGCTCRMEVLRFSFLSNCCTKLISIWFVEIGQMIEKFFKVFTSKLPVTPLE
jgi:hypothetical protein